MSDLIEKTKTALADIHADRKGWETIHRVGSLASFITMLLVAFTIIITLALYDKSQEQTLNTHQLTVDGTTYSCITVENQTGATTSLSCTPKENK